VIAVMQEGRSPIVLTERKDHLQYLVGELRGFVRHIVVLQGGMSGQERRRSLDQLASIPDSTERLILATGRYIGEGFDDARLDTLFLAMPVSWRGTLIQYSGRLHRRHPAKTEVRVYDYVDREVPMLLRCSRSASRHTVRSDTHAARRRWDSRNLRRNGPLSTTRRRFATSTRRIDVAKTEKRHKSPDRMNR
jgi:superfamily II DNA or RNA helicase